MKFLVLCFLVAVVDVQGNYGQKHLDPTTISELDDCLTTNQERGRCVKPSQCMDEGDDDDGIDITQLDVFRRMTNCCHYLKKCCPINKIILKPIQPTPPPKPAHEGCGWSNLAVKRFRSLSNKYADFGEFPWMVALMRRPSGVWVQQNYLGGGSLIHPSVVMTVAHKVYNLTSDQVRCRAGEWDTRTTNEQYAHQERDVRKMVRHKAFVAEKGWNDIALLFMDQPFNLLNAPHIGIACLGQEIPRENTECFSMGWGQTDFDKADEYAVILKKVALPIYNRQQCQSNLRTTEELGSNWKLHESMMCAGGQQGVDTCKGDGGSPLVCPMQTNFDTPRYAVYGMVAIGTGCGRKDIPGVYTDVPHQYQWIEKTVVKEGLCL